MIGRERIVDAVVEAHRGDIEIDTGRARGAIREALERNPVRSWKSVASWDKPGLTPGYDRAAIEEAVRNELEKT